MGRTLRAKIGGSLVAKICGVSDYGSPWDAWRTLVDGWKPEINLPIRVGKALEKELLPELYREKIPSGAVLYPAQEIEREEWARGHLDGVMEFNGERRVVEFKTASVRTVSKWGSGPADLPADYMCQVQFYLWLTGYALADVGVLFGNEDFQVRTIHRDDVLIDKILQQCAHFWFLYVIPERAPPIDGSDACAQWIRERYPDPMGASGAWLEPDENTSAMGAKLKLLHQQKEAAEKEAKAIRNALSERIGIERGIKGVAMKDKRGVVKVLGD